MPVPVPSSRLIPLPGHAPEDVVVDRDGWLVTGVDDGRILRVSPATGEVRVLATTGGRPLGLEVLPDGHILICDSPGGLLDLDPASGILRVLVSSFEGQPLRFCSNVVAALDGTLYFSTSSARYTIREWRHDIVENIPTGRLYRRHADGRVESLLDRLYFANGLALAADQSWIVVAETGASRLRRLWLSGPKAGQHEIFAELPGYPDNLSMSANGLIWVALPTPPNPLLTKIHKLPLSLRRLVARLPQALQPAPARSTWVMALDGDARVVHDYRQDDGSYSFVTGVCEDQGTIYLGSLAEPAILAVALPA